MLDTRWAQADEMADLIVYALSRARAIVNGAVLVADNGDGQVVTGGPAADPSLESGARVMSLPSRMRAVLIDRPGPAEVLRVVDDWLVPSPRAGEVLIVVAAAGVNRADVMQREGVYPMSPGIRDRYSRLEVSGRGRGAGGEGTRRWRIGDRVCALLIGRGYAGHAVAPEAQCLPVPEGACPWSMRGGLPETYCTVWTNLFERGRLAAGETVLVQGGTSGIGVAAIQLAKAVGAQVLATAGSEEKCSVCVRLVPIGRSTIGPRISLSLPETSAAASTSFSTSSVATTSPAKSICSSARGAWCSLLLAVRAVWPPSTSTRS